MSDDLTNALAEELHERFALAHEDHWRNLDDDEKRDTSAWDMASALVESDALATIRADAQREVVDAVEVQLARIDEQVAVGEDETLGKWAYRSRLMLLYRQLLPEARAALAPYRAERST